MLGGSQLGRGRSWDSRWQPRAETLPAWGPVAPSFWPARAPSRPGLEGRSFGLSKPQRGHLSVRNRAGPELRPEARTGQNSRGGRCRRADGIKASRDMECRVQREGPSPHGHGRDCGGGGDLQAGLQPAPVCGGAHCSRQEARGSQGCFMMSAERQSLMPLATENHGTLAGAPRDGPLCGRGMWPTEGQLLWDLE